MYKVKNSSLAGFLNRYDLIFILTVLFISLFFLFFFRLENGQAPSSSSRARLTIDQEIYLIDLDQEQIKDYPAPLGPVTVQVRQGQVGLVKASCPQKICVDQGFISQEASLVVCLPNRLTLEIIGKSGPEYDGVSR